MSAIKRDRAAFEAYALSKGCPLDSLKPLKDGSFGTTGTLAGMWAAWQAAVDNERVIRPEGELTA